MKVVGKNLKRLRKEKKLKVTEVRDYLEFESVQAIYKYESGNGYPQVETMFALMQLYDADINDLIICHEEGEGLASSPSVFSTIRLFMAFETEPPCRIAQRQRFSQTPVNLFP